MTIAFHHRERHAIARIGWLRAAVLGANDGIVSTASLIAGVAASSAATGEVLLAGTASLVAGALSMAAGEYVSVSSQADAERADLAKERRELAEHPEAERQELIGIYVRRGLTRATAAEVADQLTARDALSAHARDELGISEITTAQPLVAAGTSALTFAAGALVPLLVVLVSPRAILVSVVILASLACLAALGTLGAIAGRAPVARSLVRVTFWGLAAMAITAAVGKLFGAVV